MPNLIYHCECMTIVILQPKLVAELLVFSSRYYQGAKVTSLQIIDYPAFKWWRSRAKPLEHCVLISTNSKRWSKSKKPSLLDSWEYTLLVCGWNTNFMELLRKYLGMCKRRFCPSLASFMKVYQIFTHTCLCNFI